MLSTATRLLSHIDILPQFDESHSAEDKAKWDAAKVFFYDNVHLLLRMIFSGLCEYRHLRST